MISTTFIVLAVPNYREIELLGVNPCLDSDDSSIFPTSVGANPMQSIDPSLSH